jgi:hypothetical protein
MSSPYGTAIQTILRSGKNGEWLKGAPTHGFSIGCGFSTWFESHPSVWKVGPQRSVGSRDLGPYRWTLMATLAIAVWR